MNKFANIIVLLEVLIVCSRVQCVEFNVYCHNVAKCVEDAVCPEGSSMVKTEAGCCCESEPQECGENEEWKNCNNLDRCNLCSALFGGAQCRPSNVCQPGCGCIENHLRDENYVCVAREDCKANCPVNEVYDPCKGRCAGTCAQPDPSKLPCIGSCIQGCTCDDGYVRGNNGTCIPFDDCGKQCGANESWNCCSNDCNKCSLLLSGAQCRPVCKRGCHCHEGFYRADDGKCVTKQQCYDSQCKENEVFSECSGGCELTCKNPDPSQLVCPFICRQGCICGPGFARDANGKCVKIEFCPRTCGENEEWSSCGKYNCEQCYWLFFSVGCAPNCQPGCGCIKGYKRNDNEKCILEKDCKPICRPGEVYNGCKAYCENTCQNPKATENCKGCVKGCTCPEGQVRDSKWNCIPVAQC